MTKSSSASFAPNNSNKNTPEFIFPNAEKQRHLHLPEYRSIFLGSSSNNLKVWYYLPHLLIRDQWEINLEAELVGCCFCMFLLDVPYRRTENKQKHFKNIYMQTSFFQMPFQIKTLLAKIIQDTTMISHNIQRRAVTSSLGIEHSVQLACFWHSGKGLDQLMASQNHHSTMKCFGFLQRILSADI